jgi:signal transduction histidine kinase
MPNQTLSTLEQRELIAYEIHDGPCQYLVAAKMFFDASRQEGGEGSSFGWDSFEKGLALLSRGVDELRRFIGGLRSAHLDGSDLLTAVQRLIAEKLACGGVEIEFCHDFQDGHGDLLPPDLELAAFHIVQECLANACRHSRSTRILVGLTLDNDKLCIQVQDWGIGFDPASHRPDCFGLEGIWRRAELLGGIAVIQSRPGEGTCITVDLPLIGRPSKQPRKPDATPLCNESPEVPLVIRGPSKRAK